MAKVLVVRKPDRTIHQVPIGNEAKLMAFNNRLPEGQRWSFETMDEKDAEKLPAVDPNYVTAGEAVTKLKAAEGKLSEKDSRIAELEALLAQKAETPFGIPTVPAEAPEEAKVETAPEVIARIKAATSAKEVKEIAGKDTRKTVQDAAEAMIASLK